MVANLAGKKKKRYKEIYLIKSDKPKCPPLKNNKESLMILGVNPLYILWEILFWGLSYVTDEVLQIKVRTAEAPKLSTFAVQPNIM